MIWGLGLTLDEPCLMTFCFPDSENRMADELWGLGVPVPDRDTPCGTMVTQHNPPGDLPCGEGPGSRLALAICQP